MNKELLSGEAKNYLINAYILVKNGLFKTLSSAILYLDDKNDYTMINFNKNFPYKDEIDPIIKEISERLGNYKKISTRDLISVILETNIYDSKKINLFEKEKSFLHITNNISFLGIKRKLSDIINRSIYANINKTIIVHGTNRSGKTLLLTQIVNEYINNVRTKIALEVINSNILGSTITEQENGFLIDYIRECAINRTRDKAIFIDDVDGIDSKNLSLITTITGTKFVSCGTESLDAISKWFRQEGNFIISINTSNFVDINDYYEIAKNILFDSYSNIETKPFCIKIGENFYSRDTIDKILDPQTYPIQKLHKIARSYDTQKNENYVGNIIIFDDFIKENSMIPLDRKEIEETLKKKIIGQDQSIESIAKILSRSDKYEENRPIANLLLIGPTGVGKTETAITIANRLYPSGDQNNILILNMAEYSQDHMVSKIIGSPSGYVGYGNPTEMSIFLSQRGNMGGVILFDEIEKTADATKNILLSILDKGVISMADNKRFSLSKYIIICTSNAVNQTARSIGFGDTEIDMFQDKIMRTNFAPEFINRFDLIAQFNSLSLDSLEKIAILKINESLEKIKKLYNVEIEIEDNIDKIVIDKMIKDSSNLENTNGRSVLRFVRNNIEPIIFDKISEDKSCRNFVLKYNNETSKFILDLKEI